MILKYHREIRTAVKKDICHTIAGELQENWEKTGGHRKNVSDQRKNARGAKRRADG